MSAHVVPKAKPYPESDDDEKTNIESQWEDEASTTVEQGEVAEKIRGLNLDPPPRRTVTNVTSTGHLEEPTVDDQHAHSAIQAIVPPLLSRLVITAGNDSGRELDIFPGKSYTIGRGLDNDVVLTDIAVSRKHFDLRNEDGAWVVVDRGSGNGTVVNGNIEDNPFMLANGDVIEIGNTVFRFDQPNAPVARASSLDVELDDEEMSTVAGKVPVREDIVETLETPPKPAASPMVGRPKTLPPPMPMRSHGMSQPPPSYSLAGGQPASTMPLPQMANRPVLAPQAPTLLAADGMQPPLPGMMPTTPPSQAPTQMQMAGQRPYGYPQASEIPPHSVHAQMLVIQAQNGRGDGSTAHVPPTPFGGVPTMPAPQMPRPYVQPQLSRRAKLILGGAGLTLLAAVLTVAIIKSGTPAAKEVEPKPGSAAHGPTVEPIKTDSIKVEPIKTDPPKTDKVTTTEPKPTAKVDPPKVDPPKVAPPKVEPPKTDKITKVEPPKVEPPKVEPPKIDPPKIDPPRTDKTAKVDPPKVDPPRTDKTAKVDPPRTDKVAKNPKTTKRTNTATTPTPRVAAAVDLDAVKSKADTLYRAKKFSDASNVLAAAAKSADGSDAQQLRHNADLYARVGRALTAAAAPASKPTETYEQLRSALSYDRVLGGAFESEIQGKLSQVAPKAAIQFMANKDYPNARTAIIQSENLGVSNESVKMVKQKLERVAGDLYGEAKAELSSNPDGAKDKVRQIQQIVDQKSPWYAKAAALLKGG